jgi:hypothetical protein
LWEVLRKFAIRGDGFLTIHEYRTASHTGSAGIDGHDVWRATHRYRFLR